MGIKNLRKFLKNSAPSGISIVQFFTEFKNKTVCIDLNSYLYKMVYNMETKGKNYYLKGFTQIIVDLLTNNIMPIFIFDGAAPILKSEVISARKQVAVKNKATIDKSNIEIYKLLNISLDSGLDINDEIDKALSEREFSEDELKLLAEHSSIISKSKKNIITVSKEMYTNLEHLFDLWGVPWIRAKGEADFLCSRLVIDGVADAVISEDMDIIAHGCFTLITGFMTASFLRDKMVEVFSLTKILEELHITQSQFIDFCILSGCDYCATIRDIGPIKAYQLILQYVDLEHFPETIIIPQRILTARDEFHKSELEDYDVSMIKLSRPKEKELCSFLISETTFRLATIVKKLDAVRAMS
jgi:flap endonuclease-1